MSHRWAFTVDLALESRATPEARQRLALDTLRDELREENEQLRAQNALLGRRVDELQAAFAAANVSELTDVRDRLPKSPRARDLLGLNNRAENIYIHVVKRSARFGVEWQMYTDSASAAHCSLFPFDAGVGAVARAPRAERSAPVAHEHG